MQTHYLRSEVSVLEKLCDSKYNFKMMKSLLNMGQMKICLLTVICKYYVDCLINPLKCFFGIKCHVSLDRNPGQGYNSVLLRLIPGDFYSACSHTQFHTLHSL